MSITEQVKNFFAQVIGFKSQTITRKASAAFQGPVSMGSPANGFGNEPIGTGDRKQTTRRGRTSTAPARPQAAAEAGSLLQLQGSISPGPQSIKQNGDALQALWCDSGNPDGCSAFNRSVGPPPSNTDYSPEGYFYRVDVERPSAPTS